MTKAVKLSEKWMKASIIGTIWASSEIVLGSFLHNLKVPFSGSILTAIGVILLISVSHVWREKALFIRSGLICALLKTMSPSAVIFGPMIAIIAEAVLLETSVLIFGRTTVGFMLGALLAAMWSFIQKIINYLIFYGFNIVDLYKSLMIYVEKQFNIQINTLWLPLILLLMVYAIIGVISGFIGIKTGKQIANQSRVYHPKPLGQANSFGTRKKTTGFNYSVIWLLANIVAIVGALVLIAKAPFWVWSAFVVVMVILWIIRYKRSLRQLLKPKFWIFFVLITMFTAFVFSRMQLLPISETLLIGLKMNFRATIIILGFSALGTELYNPKIRELFLNSYLKQLPVAVALAVESLPGVITSIPDLKTLLKQPVKIFGELIAYAEYRLQEIHEKQLQPNQVFVLSGRIDSGKTTFLKSLINKLKPLEIKVGGIYSQKIMEHGARIGYDLVNINSNEQQKFLRNNGEKGVQQVGEFTVLPGAVHFGNQSLLNELSSDNDLIIIDEVGKLELLGQAWAQSLPQLFKTDKTLLLVVRDYLVAEVLEKWQLQKSTVFNFPETHTSIIENKIIKFIERNRPHP